MPGSVTNASPSTVLPDGLCTAFRAAREFWVSENFYRNGESQVALRVATSRKAWELSRRLVAADVVTLRDFYDDRDGNNEPFYFYDLLTHKTAVHDPTGVASTGRYTVRFEGAWEQSMGMARGDVTLRLVEVN